MKLYYFKSLFQDPKKSTDSKVVVWVGGLDSYPDSNPKPQIYH